MFHVEHCSRTTQGGTGPEEVRSNLPEPTPPALVSLTAPHYAAGSKALSGARKTFHVEHCLICQKLGLHPEVESNRHGANAIFSRARSLSAAGLDRFFPKCSTWNTVQEQPWYEPVLRLAG